MIPDRFDLVIDGYNLMHVAGYVLCRVGPGVFEQQRDRFLHWLLQQLPAAIRPFTIVVFDGRETTNREVTITSFRGVQLRFSPEGVEADDLIESLIEAHSAPKNLTVISSDHRLHRAAQRRKALCIDSEQFIVRMAALWSDSESGAADKTAAAAGRTGAAPGTHHRKPADLSAEEVDEWLQVFAEAEQFENAADLPDPRWSSTIQPTSKPNLSARNRRAVDPGSSAATPPPASGRPATHVTDPTQGSQSRQEAGSSPECLSDRPVPEDVAFWELRVRELLAGDAGSSVTPPNQPPGQR